MFFPLIYLAVYTIVSAYRNIKMFMKGYQRVATTPDALLHAPISNQENGEFPACLLDSNRL